MFGSSNRASSNAAAPNSFPLPEETLTLDKAKSTFTSTILKNPKVSKAILGNFKVFKDLKKVGAYPAYERLCAIHRVDPIPEAQFDPTNKETMAPLVKAMMKQNLPTNTLISDEVVDQFVDICRDKGSYLTVTRRLASLIVKTFGNASKTGNDLIDTAVEAVATFM